MSSTATGPRVAVVGVSSLIGEALIAELRARQFSFASLAALDDQRHVGAAVEDDDRRLPVQDVSAYDFSQADLVFFCGRSALSERYAREAARHALVIDGSSHFRAEREVPLVVADVNPQALTGFGPRGLIALPGSASVALLTALAPLHRVFGLKRAEVSTYHAVSGAGRPAIDELAGETVAMLSGKTARGRAFGRQIAFNVIAQVGALEASGLSSEERQMAEETCRVLGSETLQVNVTAVRVPVFFGHGLAVHAAFENSVTVETAREALAQARGIELTDARGGADLPTPATLATAPDRVYLGRLRADVSRERGLNFWLVADNVRKCAAHNAVSVAQILVNRPQ